MLKLLFVAGVGLVVFVVYKLWKAGKSVTAGSVASSVDSTVKTAVQDVKNDISKL